jgi:hypothetical protein
VDFVRERDPPASWGAAARVVGGRDVRDVQNRRVVYGGERSEESDEGYCQNVRFAVERVVSQRLRIEVIGLVAAAILPRIGHAQVATSSSVPTARRDAAHTTALLPGFETLDDGSTRLFVDLSAPTSFETKTGNGSITYVLKDTHVARRNNCNPLVTGFFNTPVTTARLEPHGHDLWFVVEVRAPVQPSVSVDPNPSKDGGAAEGSVALSIHFPKGDYLPPQPAGAEAPAFAQPGGSEAPIAPASSSSTAPRAMPARTPHGASGGAHSHRRGGGAAGSPPAN